MKTLATLPLLSLLLSFFFGVDYAQSTYQTDNLALNCQQLKHQMASLDASISNSPNGNQGLERLLLSGLIGIQVQKSNNQSSVTRRIDHLNKLYSRKCYKSN